MKYFMGVDGGGSKTYAVITNEHGNLIGEGISGASNYKLIGLEKAMENIKQSMDRALKSARLTYSDIEFVQYALAGADREADFVKLRSGLTSIPVNRWDLVCDTIAGLRTGSPENVGVVLICGSGTNAVGRSITGKTVQTGGFGYFYGDAAGGNQMALDTFRAAIRSWEYREIPSILTVKVPKFFGHETMEDLLEDFLERNVQRVPGELTIVLHEAVEEGDALAIQIMERTGVELGITVNSVMKRMGEFGVKTIPIVLTGSVFQRGRNEILLNSIEKTVRDYAPNTHFIIPEMEPVFGAVLLAMDRYGVRVTPEIIQKFNGYRRGMVIEE